MCSVNHEPLRAPGAMPIEPWGETLSGDKYYYLNPDPSVIKVKDIARSLAYTCRYNGHLHRYYSVAEHCIHMANAAGDPMLARPWFQYLVSRLWMARQGG